MKESVSDCERCGARCRVASKRNPKARMLRRSKLPKGLCINCAVHDWLRNTYPANIILADSRPTILLNPSVRAQFAAIMRAALSDAVPEEINWNLIVENWELPFPHKVKSSAVNPLTQKELDEIQAGKRPGLGKAGPHKPDPLGGKTTITSFEDLNLLEPGLGDSLRKAIGNTLSGAKETDKQSIKTDPTESIGPLDVPKPDSPDVQKRLF